MSSNDVEAESSAPPSEAMGGPESAEPAEQKRKLDIAVAITDTGPCKKHLKITIPRTEIDRHFKESLDSFRREAAVPGFRPGRAPKELINKRFRKQMSEQVKSTLLRSSLEQIDEEHELDPISQPNLDVDAIEIPEEGPMNIEMDVEVRPQFDVPEYKGLQVRRPTMDLPETEVATRVTRFLERYGQLVPKLEGGAELGDTLTADLSFRRSDGQFINDVKEIVFRLRSELRFQNGTAPNIGETLLGVRPGETRLADARLGTAVGDPTLRGQPIKMEVHVTDLKQTRLPEINQEFLHSIGFDSMEDLREAIRAVLRRQFKGEQAQVMRRQIVDALLRQTPFDLPVDLVTREEKNTIARLVAQLKREGMSEEQIRAQAAEIRANAQEVTLRSLKEFLLMAKIADAEGIKVEDEDIAAEIDEIAERTDESSRRVRARIEKEGGLDTLMTQILESKVVAHILKFATVEDVVVAPEPQREVETLDHTANVPDESHAGPTSEKQETGP
jgi:trigger factor